MGFGVGQPDLALYRLIKGGDTGLNIRLADLLDREMEVPNLRDLMKSFLTGQKLKVKIKGLPVPLIKRLETIQREIDEQIQTEINKAKRKTNT
jgi:hypothetical protein